MLPTSAANFDLSLQMKGFAESATFRGTNICYSSRRMSLRRRARRDKKRSLWRGRLNATASTLSLSISRGSRLKSNVFEQRSLSCPPLSLSLLSPQSRPLSLFRFCLLSPPHFFPSSWLAPVKHSRYRDGKKAASFQIKTDFKSLAPGLSRKAFFTTPISLPPPSSPPPSSIEGVCEGVG